MTVNESVRAIYAAFGAGDVQKILGMLSEDVEWEHDAQDYGIGWMVPGRGRQHVVRFFERLGEIELRVFEVQSLLSGGTQVAAIIRVEFVVKATGKVVRDLEAHLWTFDSSGQVARFRHFTDTAGIVAALRA